MRAASRPAGRSFGRSRPVGFQISSSWTKTGSHEHNISVTRSTSFSALHCACVRGGVNNLSVAITYRCNEVSSFVLFPLQCVFASHSNTTLYVASLTRSYLNEEIPNPEGNL
ncbi:uncharacterized protein LOC112451714 isoform X2 [Temnothorax curvispinosus]|uniref:Uncharacterized protein LOC112451714 isoform X2 n=1 Tax=Temnothorax curvispinosus TaxID=300111 RepID=A0A6J1PDG4_9HYME|nr:uncharacterized protein LOC112451714 isoform X2 [Temnothorax curvispinosus]